MDDPAEEEYVAKLRHSLRTFAAALRGIADRAAAGAEADTLAEVSAANRAVLVAFLAIADSVRVSLDGADAGCER